MKFKNITKDDITLRGVEFPAGKAVKVEDEGLAQKVGNMAEFVSVRAKAKASVENKA